MEQKTLEFPKQHEEVTATTLTGMVLQILSDDPNRYWMPWELCDRILFVYKVKISDSSLTARLRELRGERYGSHIIVKRIRDGSRAYEYRLEK